ncbi:hypothetical protein [Histidinibacterium lentulum]|uniref:Alkaline proteinase inhibitor/ Outer membrane lipoprotein Omp19 domain-containing protein n=1 Tax=Histidinibacterium lentulum TaxID=2480588 RepID=A0A3N2RA71_9RHOB|nr:hypothetical protein [Histidinibacterium lentulum]ROU04301.1 hypothetical protein EAT49_02615 [Histidinibacterium lentulum]
MRLLVLCLGLALSAEAARAEWTYDPAPLPAGEALGPGPGGLSLAVSCGNGGLPAVEVRGWEPPKGMEPLFVLSVDDGAEELIPGACLPGSARCLVSFETLDQAQGFVRALRRGSRADIGLYRNGMLGTVGLTGSDASIGRVGAGGCELD